MSMPGLPTAQVSFCRFSRNMVPPRIPSLMPALARDAGPKAALKAKAMGRPWNAFMRHRFADPAGGGGVGRENASEQDGIALVHAHGHPIIDPGDPGRGRRRHGGARGYVTLCLPPAPPAVKPFCCA